MGRRNSQSSGDEELIEQVRCGDDAAFAELYRRHHHVARSTARYFTRSGSEADDVVADAFAGVLSALRSGLGPRDHFRQYLLACVRNGTRSPQRQVPVAPDDGRLEPHEAMRSGNTFEDPERYVEADTVARAFATLTPRWQQLLWWTAVEQKSVQEIGVAMELSPNAVAALSYRAREAFATAYLAEHAATYRAGSCSQFAEDLAGYVRQRLSPTRTAAIADHVSGCPDCRRATEELRDVNTSLRSLAPAAGTTVVARAAANELPALVGASSGWLGLSAPSVLLAGALGALVLVPLFIAQPWTVRRDPEPEVLEAAGLPEPASDSSQPPDDPAVAPAVVDPADTQWVPVAAAREVADPATSSDVQSPASPIAVPAATVLSPTAGPAGSAVSSRPVATTTMGPTEGLLGTLGADDLARDLGLPRIAAVVGGADTVVLTVTRDVVAPLLDIVVDALPVPLDFDLLSEIPGVVLVPTTTLAAHAGQTPAPTASPAPNSASPTPPVALPAPPTSLPVPAPLPSPPTTFPAPATTLLVVSVPPLTLPVISVPVLPLPTISVPPITIPVTIAVPLLGG